MLHCDSDSVGFSITKLLFFDTGLPRMAACRENFSCKDDPDFLCRHRLGENTEVLYLDDLKCVSFLRLYDFQVILYFLYLIAYKKIPFAIHNNCQYIIVTHDLTFIRSAEEVWKKRGKKKSQKVLKFDCDHVTAEIRFRNWTEVITIVVVSLRLKNPSQERWRKKIISIFGNDPSS